MGSWWRTPVRLRSHREFLSFLDWNELNCLNVLDRSTHNSITQDTLEIKLLLLKLRRILQEVGDTLYHVVEYRIQKWTNCITLKAAGYRYRYEGGYNNVLCIVKPLITNTSEEFIKCRLDNFSMSFILYYVNFSICKNK